MTIPGSIARLLLYFILIVHCWSNALAAEVVQVRVNPRLEFQQMDGFGASDAWACQFVGKNWPLAKRERIADLLFSREVDGEGNPRGIGLSLWRFNITAGTAEQGEASGISNVWRRGECFLNSDGSYDWSRQAGQQWFLQAARRRGVEKFLAFLNSPPVFYTRNGKGYAPAGITNINLGPGKMELYANFLAEVMAHFDEQGQHFNYLSPFNEPQWSWDEPTQEGTPALNIEEYDLIRYLSHDLDQRGLTTQLAIGEAGSIGHAAIRMGNDGRDQQAAFFFQKDSPFYVGKLPNVAPLISAHDYGSVWPLDQQVEYRRKLHAAIRAANPKLGYWMSEYCILENGSELGGGDRRDLGMDTALFVARLIHNDLTLACARSWQWWTALSLYDFKDGLIYLDDGSLGDTGRMGPEVRSLTQDGVFRESKLLWTLGNFARFVRPGMARIECLATPPQTGEKGVMATAFKGAKGRLVVVLVNLSTEGRVGDLGGHDAVSVYTTSADSNLKHSVQKAAGIEVPARSVVTVVRGGAERP
jgi:O-glycosyl hydrolase